MRRFALLLAVTLAPILSAQDKISQIRKELLDPFMEESGECLALAKAVPEEKYKWRPMEGVRSFGEVFAHMAGSTLLFCSYNGVKPPAGAAHDLAVIYMKRGFEMPEIFSAERAIKSKAQTIEVMDQAFHVAADMIRQMPDSDLEKRVDFFGTPMTMRGMLIHLDEHLGEHLGQAIAYARVNHIVPPWSRPAP
jgi:uncharacterized damage-inducible protein DinB